VADAPPFAAITTVYSYYLPEVRAVIDSLVARYPHDVFLRSLEPGGLDAFHEPVLEKLVRAHASDVHGLGDFRFRYPTSGSEEGIREYLSTLAARGVKRIYMLRGDYEGYREVARSRGIETREVALDEDPRRLEPGHWFLSNPSARDGNLLPPDVPRAILDAGHRVFYDLSYLGSTGEAIFDLTHPNVAAAVISFSKTYGLFYYRIGFTFSREEIPALYANKWFKNVLSLLIADRVLDLDGRSLARRCKALQAEIVERVNRAHGLGLAASDAFLLAHLTPERARELPPAKLATIARFERDRGYRFCLTPYFLEHERA
jgi:histidinol-phosphate/aromatic aminotransferase/cobyric acid decarboxylase-like protein